MEVIYTVADLRSALATRRESTIGLVPTMGALHAGHLSLVERARRECDVVVVSIFVNPTQFNDKNDLAAYPRTLPEDLKLLAPVGPDYIFAPSVEEVYPTPDTRQFDFGVVDKVMEGASRPGHFNGVGQVVSKLFNFVEPHKAYFGEKDFQQIAVIKELVRQMECPVEIVECPIVRDADGLALSSRNTLLDAPHRAAAPHIYATLRKAVKRKAEFDTPADMVAWVETEINTNPLLHCIYFEVVDPLSMQSVEEWPIDCNTQGCIAVQCGSVRLIDNIKI